MVKTASDKQFPTIVLAGGHKNIRLHDIANFFTDMYRYREHYLPMGSYKTIREIEGTINDQPGRYPLILFLLNTLRRTPSIGKVKIIGPKPELEIALAKANFPTSQFEIVAQGKSFGENMMLGYNAFGGKGHVLLVMGDSPLTSAQSIENFIELSQTYLDYDIIIPVVKAAILDDLARFMPRPYMRMRPDGMEPQNYYQPIDLDKRGRISVRLTSLALTNLEGTTVEQINHLRSLRKLLRPAVQRLIREDLGANILIQYRRGIPFTWLSKKFEQLYYKSMLVVGLSHAGAAIDVDSSADLRVITKILNYQRRRKQAKISNKSAT